MKGKAGWQVREDAEMERFEIRGIKARKPGSGSSSPPSSAPFFCLSIWMTF